MGGHRRAPTRVGYVDVLHGGFARGVTAEAKSLRAEDAVRERSSNDMARRSRRIATRLARSRSAPPSVGTGMHGGLDHGRADMGLHFRLLASRLLLQRCHV